VAVIRFVGDFALLAISGYISCRHPSKLSWV